MPDEIVAKKKGGYNKYRIRPRLRTLSEFYQTKYAHARALLDMGQTYRQVMEQTGLSRESVARVSTGVHMPPAGLVDSLKAAESAKLTVLAHECLDKISDDDFLKAGLTQKIVSFGILFDKRQLLDGRPSAIIGILRPPTELDVEIAALQVIVDAPAQ